jgi:DNA-binding response OmpR family regulator
VLRRTRHTRPPLRGGRLALDPLRQEVRFAGRPLELTRYEYLLLTGRRPRARVHEARGAARDLTLLHRACPQDARRSRCRLRKKLEHAGAVGYVVNRRGVGYRLVDRVRAVIDQGGTPELTANGSGSLAELARTRGAAA